MNRRLSRLLVSAATTVAWTLLAVDAILTDEQINFSDGLSMLVACTAAVGSLILAGWARARPAAELYEMGYDAGRRQAKIDAAARAVSRENVVVQFRRRVQ